MDTGILIILIVLIVTTGLFWFLRDFFCWYWKINERNDLLKQILEKISEEEIPEGYYISNDKEENIYCVDCCTDFPEGSGICPNCGKQLYGRN